MSYNNPVNNVTGAGAKYVASARKAQASSAAKKAYSAASQDTFLGTGTDAGKTLMSQNPHDIGMSKMWARSSMAAGLSGGPSGASSPGIPAHPEVRPAPAGPSPTTGTEHLSFSQFSGATRTNHANSSRSMMPGGFGAVKPNVKRTTGGPGSMHPGGFSTGKTVLTPALPSMGNVSPGAAMTVRSGGSAGGSRPKFKANGLKAGVRSAVRQKLSKVASGSRANGKSAKPFMFRPVKSRHAGANEKILRAATGA